MLAIAALDAAFLLVLADRYGPHRDELYFASAGHHLAWGYPDQPTLTPLIAVAADMIAPGNLVVLRLSSALAAAALVVVSALTARELGGRRDAQILTGVVVGTGVVTLVLGHLLSTTSLDVLFWCLVVLFALRALGRDQPKWWLTAGVTAGVGLENKTLLAFLVAALGVGVLVHAGSRHHLRSPWLWAGAAAAVAIWAPNLVWQATHGWPQLTLSADINQEYRVAGERIFYVVQQLIMFSPLASVVWVFGLWRLMTAPRWVWARPLATAYLVLLVVFAVSGGKGYYLAGIIPALIAAGCVELGERWERRRIAVAAVVLALFAAVAWPAAVPLLPEKAFADSPYAFVGQDQLETIGWPEFVATLRGVLQSLPPDERGTAVVYAENYGEAGALVYYGLAAPVYSGHNGFGSWGPPPQTAAPVIVVGLTRPGTVFAGCRPTTRIDNAHHIDNEERGMRVWVCAKPRSGWSNAWPRLTHLDA